MKKIAVFLFEGAELFEIASFTDIFGWNNVVGLKKFRDIKLETISYKESIKCTWGGSLKVEKVITEKNIEEIFNYDVLVIPGGFGKANFFEEKNNEIFKKIIKYFYNFFFRIKLINLHYLKTPILYQLILLIVSILFLLK